MIVRAQSPRTAKTILMDLKDFIVDREINSYKDALDGADVVLGLSRADILEAKILKE